MVRPWGLFIAISCYLLLVGQQCFGGEVTARVDRNPIAVDESVELVLEVKGKVSAEPDFSVLSEDFEILNQSTSSNIQMINGRTSRSVQYRLSLMPRRAGNLVIPPLAVDKYASEPIALVVTMGQAALGNRSGSDNIFLEVAVEPESPYVGAQVVYTLRLYMGVSLAGGSLSEPEVAEASIQKLGDDREYSTTRNGRSYRVVERRYILFPRQAGQITIAPVVFQGRLGRRSNSLFDPFAQAGPTKRLYSEAITLEVQPQPADAPDPWLPAAKMELSASWSAQTDTVRAGEPLTLTINLEADGLPGNLLPEPQLALDEAIKQYPDQAQFKDRIGPVGIVGSLSKKIALVVSQPGTYTIPVMEIPYWNTTTNSVAVASLPAREIIVQPGVEAPLSQPPPVSIRESAAVSSVGAAPEEALSWNRNGLWPWFSLFFGAGWLVTAFFWWRSRRKSTGAATGSDARDDNSQLQRLHRGLRQACANNDPQGAKKVLTSLPVAHLNAMVLAGTAMGDELARLDQYLYSRERQKKAWQGQALFEAWKELQDAERSGSSVQKERLRDLYGTGI